MLRKNAQRRKNLQCNAIFQKECFSVLQKRAPQEDTKLVEKLSNVDVFSQFL